jgi:hypothetical protein
MLKNQITVSLLMDASSIIKHTAGKILEVLVCLKENMITTFMGCVTMSLSLGLIFFLKRHKLFLTFYKMYVWYIAT